MTAAAHSVPEVERIDVGVAWSARPTEAWYERASRTVRVGTGEVRRRSRVRREGGGAHSTSYDYTWKSITRSSDQGLSKASLTGTRVDFANGVSDAVCGRLLGAQKR